MIPPGALHGGAPRFGVAAATPFFLGDFVNEFDAARERYERKRLGKQSADMGKHFERPILHLPKSPKINGRHNEIDVTVFVRGEGIALTFKAPIAGTLLGSQITQSALKNIIGRALATTFGTVT